MAKFYGRLVAVLTQLQHPFILIFRLYWGWQFFVSGRGKFGNIEMVSGFFRDLAIPLPLASAYLVATVEMVGGLLLLLGLGSRLAAIPLAVTMVVALLTAHREALLGLVSDPDKFMAQEPYPFLVAVLIVMIFGPGIFSLDCLIRRCRKG